MSHPNPERRVIAPPEPEHLLAGLTPEQAQAVTHGTGPLLLIAGPGAGKTRTLTHRIAHLLITGQAQPSEILAVTFSVRAAGELRLRLADLLGRQQARGVTAATFHAVCARLLREHARLFGRTEQYTIYDQGDMRRVIDWILSDKERAEVQAALSQCGQPPSSEVQTAISAAKNQLLDPSSFANAAQHPATAVIAAVWQACEEELCRSNAWDFDDLLAYGVRLLRTHGQRLQWIRSRWRWLLVDEFQDVNRAQAELVLLLAGPDGNVAVVADDDQVVHRFRGADPGHIVGFAKRYPGHAAIVLARNFRSRSQILEAACRCVAHNQRRVQKQLVAVRGGGGIVEVRGFYEDWHEAHWVAGQVAEAIAAGVPGPEILILARTGYATQAMQLSLARAGIPHRVLGSLGLYERTEVKDALAYLTLLVNPADAQAFRRAIQSPRRRVGPATANQIVTRARKELHGDLILACSRVDEIDGVRSGEARQRLTAFGEGMNAVRLDIELGRSLGHAVLGAVMLDGGLVHHYEQRRDTSPNAAARRDAERVLEDLRSLCRAAQVFEQEHRPGATLGDFLEHAAGLHAQELGAGEDRRVTVSTIHRAKGTEATLVILLGCEEQLLPSWQSLASPDPEALCEERRLFYVAATRAKDRLILTHVRTRGWRDTAGPSRFLYEAGLCRTAGTRAA
jgi:DNA helicase II / ATP-dependent DNA helicase PcrA